MRNLFQRYHTFYKHNSLLKHEFILKISCKYIFSNIRNSYIIVWHLEGDGCPKRTSWKVIFWKFSAMKLHENSKYRVNNIL